MATRLQRLRREGVVEAFPLASPAFRRAAPWLLALVAAAGILTRIHPAIRYAVWGSDSGEYLFLTQQLVDTGRVLFAYDGWGIAYPFFPGMFVLSGAAHAVLGVEVFHAVLWVTPMLGGAIGVLVGLLAYRVTSDPRVGVIAGAFAAVTAPILITTSHAMPGTLGHVFLLGILVLLPDAYRDGRGHILPLALLGAALLFTHHLSTYFAVGIIAFIAFYREAGQQRTQWKRLRVDLALSAALLLAAAVWWLGVATPFREDIVGDALKLSPWLTAVGFVAALAALPAIVIYRRRRISWHHPTPYPSFLRQRVYVYGGFLGFVGILLYLIYERVPGTDIHIAPVTLLYALPVLAVLCFLPVGVSTSRFYRHGTLPLAWLGAVLASLAFASVTNSKVLFPFRHVDYMVEAMAVLAAIGIVLVYDQAVAASPSSERAKVRGNATTVVVAILVLGALLSLPPREVIGGFEEGVTPEELEAVRWVNDHPDIIRHGATFAADHRISSILWGLAGASPTWDYTPQTYHSESADVVFEELADAQVPPLGKVRVDYIFLSPPIEEGVTLLQWEQSSPMSAAAISKFEDDTRFEPVYSEDDVRIYRVLWPGTIP